MNPKKIAIICTIILLFSISSCGFTIVNAGHRGIQITLGKVKEQSMEEGIYFYNPLTSDMIEMDVRTQKKPIQTPVYTKDVQQAQLTGVVNYNLDKTKAHVIYEEVGREWDEVLVTQVVEASIKNVIGKWDAVDLVANRDSASAAIKKSIMAGLDNRGVTVSHFEITNIDFADAFENAVEAKVVAIQRASEAENKTVQVEEEAKQKVIAAKAEAESMRIRAAALSQNKSLVQYEAVQKWDGKMPQYMLGDSMPLINLSQ